MQLLSLLTVTLSAFMLLVPSAIAQESKGKNSDSATVDVDSAQDQAYIFTYFNTGAEGESQGLQYAYSYDGLKWKKLNSPAGTFLAPEVGGKLLRDPSVVLGPDGLYHMVWTTDWWKHGIGLAHSKDLIHWSEQTYVDVMANHPDTVNCWAPEISYDSLSQQYFIYWASTIPGKFPKSEGLSETFSADPVKGVQAAHRMYVTTTKDFKEFTPAQLYFDDGYNCIDAFVVRDEARNRYVMAIKNEDLNPVAKKDIRLAFSDSALGPWTKSTEPITPTWVEGPALLQIGEWWYLYYDAYTRNRYEGLKTKDFTNWISITEELEVPDGMRHGTPIAIPKTLLNEIKKHCKAK